MFVKLKIVLFLVTIFNVLGCSYTINHKPFPPNFLFGTATSAYQVEGAWNISKKSRSIWDFATHNTPEKIADGSNGDIACDSYHKIDEDIKNLKFLNVDYYSFSISWTRLLPGVEVSFVNPDGVRYYNELIDKLIANNIIPVVTLSHWDLNHNAQVFLGGWLNELLVRDFGEYARMAFKLFGDRVKHWITFNDPFNICGSSYELAAVAPFLHFPGIGLYTCSRNLLLAHATAYHIYKNEFFQEQQGIVGITINSPWFMPASKSKEDIEATNRALQMHLDWYLHPILSERGDYPEIMYKRIDSISKTQGYNNSRLPPFNKEEIAMLKSSVDFIGLNHVGSHLVSNVEENFTKPPKYLNDVGVNLSFDKSWNNTARDVYKVYPQGIRHLLNYIKDKYNNPVVYIIGVGYSGFQNETIEDDERIWYHKAYLKEVLKSIHEDNCNVQSYTVFSLMDSFEWSEGYTLKYGLFRVDFNDPARTRIPKKSAHELKNIFHTHVLN